MSEHTETGTDESESENLAMFLACSHIHADLDAEEEGGVENGIEKRCVACKARKR